MARRARIEAVLNTPEFYRCRECHSCWRLNEKFAYGKMEEAAYREGLTDLLSGHSGVKEN